jgi:group I intron endonuclease
MGFIYKITNLKSGKCYIGETVRPNPEARWKQHIQKINKGKGCPALRDAINKYGLDNFKFEVIIICFDEDRYKYEKEYIKKYNSQVPFGYNILSGGQIGESRLGIKHTPEAIQKMVDSVRKFREENPNYYETYREKHQESIKKINHSEKIIKSEKYQKAVKEKRVGCGINVIGKSIEERKVQIKEGVIKYYDNGGIVKHRELMSKALGKRIIQYSNNNDILQEFISIGEASRISKVGKRNIQHVLSGRAKTAGGYIWRYVDEKNLKT